MAYAGQLYFFSFFSVTCRRQKAAQSSEQTAATRRLERRAWSQSPNFIIITGTYAALICHIHLTELISTTPYSKSQHERLTVKHGPIHMHSELKRRRLWPYECI